RAGAGGQEHVRLRAAGRGDVQAAVVVEVGQGHRVGGAADGVVLGRPEAAVALPEQHRHRSVRVGGDDVEVAVAAHVADGHRGGSPPDGKVLRGPQSAGAVVQEYADVVPIRFGHDDVGLAVAVDVPHGQLTRAGAGEVRRDGVTLGEPEEALAG